MPAREFDLNIERVLENWTLAHAIRELIANALDEAALTGTQEPEITKDAGCRWHVRDFGRGLRYEHLTQNENREKLASPEKVVGKFGVGLKDALATFDRRGVGVRIRSRFGDITTHKQAKQSCESPAVTSRQDRVPFHCPSTGRLAVSWKTRSGYRQQ
jgi:hypothetical protein